MLALDIYLRPVPPSGGGDYSLSPFIVGGIALVLLGIVVGAVLATLRARAHDPGAAEGGPETAPIPELPDDDLALELDALLVDQRRLLVDQRRAGGCPVPPVEGGLADVRIPAEVH